MNARDFREYRIETLSFLNYSEVLNAIDNVACDIEEDQIQLRNLFGELIFRHDDNKGILRGRIKNVQQYMANNIQTMDALCREITLRDHRGRAS